MNMLMVSLKPAPMGPMGTFCALAWAMQSPGPFPFGLAPPTAARDAGDDPEAGEDPPPDVDFHASSCHHATSLNPVEKGANRSTSAGGAGIIARNRTRGPNFIGTLTREQESGSMRDAMHHD